MASLVLFHCFALAYSQQHDFTVFESQWPASVPRSSNMSPHLRGFPFIAGSATSFDGHPYFREYITYSAPGTTANIFLIVLNTTATYLLFDLLRRRNYKFQLSLKSLFVVVTFMAFLLAVIANTKLFDESIFPQLGLMRCIRLPDIQSSLFFGIGVVCSGMLIGYSLINGLSLIFHRFGPTATKSDG